MTVFFTFAFIIEGPLSATILLLSTFSWELYELDDVLLKPWFESCLKFDRSICCTLFNVRSEPICIEVVGPRKSWITIRMKRSRNLIWSYNREIYSSRSSGWLKLIEFMEFLRFRFMFEDSILRFNGIDSRSICPSSKLFFLRG